MSSKRRYVGTSHMFNVGRNHEFHNGFDIRINGDHVEAAISSGLEPHRKMIVSAHGPHGISVRDLLAMMEREDLRSRKLAGEFAFPKKRRKRNLAVEAKCIECGGYGGNEDGDGNWKECQLCH